MKRKTNESTTGSGSIASAPGTVTHKPIDRGGVYKQHRRSGGNLLTGRVTEEELAEDDLIIVPGQRIRRKTGLVPRDQKRTDHEVAMARSDLIAALKSAKAIYELIKDRDEDTGIEGWVQEKLIKANDYLTAVREYYEEQAVSASMDNNVADDDSGSYGMSDCGCGPECNCRPDFSSMFESAMRSESRSKSSKSSKPIKNIDPNNPPQVSLADLPKDKPLGKTRRGSKSWDPQADIPLKHGYTEEGRTKCPECGGAAYGDRMLAEKRDACYHKVKSRYKVWPSAYASGALVKCRKAGAKNWGKSKK